jgi:hypothetical protein
LICDRTFCGTGNAHIRFPRSLNSRERIIGWLGVRQIGSIGAQQLGFVVWIIGGLLLIAWGYHTKARAIMLINGVNVIMAASALAALV